MTYDEANQLSHGLETKLNELKVQFIYCKPIIFTNNTLDEYNVFRRKTFRYLNEAGIFTGLDILNMTAEDIYNLCVIHGIYIINELNNFIDKYLIS